MCSSPASGAPFASPGPRLPCAGRSGRVLAACALLLAMARPVAAQVVGRVVAEGVPVEEARVELWAGARRVAERTTQEDGRFSFPEDTAAGASGLLVTRLGYAPARV